MKFYLSKLEASDFILILNIEIFNIIWLNKFYLKLSLFNYIFPKHDVFISTEGQLNGGIKIHFKSSHGKQITAK